jgi:hypothetical protein
MRRKAEIYYREPGPRKAFKRNPDGSKRTWDLAHCLKFEFKGDSWALHRRFGAPWRLYVLARWESLITAPSTREKC